jgi:K+-sensing histidine kinase KdpD
VSDRSTSLADTELVGLVVHDLRSPIAALAANFGFLRTTPSIASDAIAIEAIRDAESATLILQHLVDNLSVLATLEAGAVEAPRETVLLPAFVASCLERLAPITASSEVHIDVRFDGRAQEPLVQSAPRLLRTVIENLVLTALRHTTRREPVVLEVRSEGTDGVLEVRDGGAALPEAVAAQLFTREGQRAAKRESASRYGRGLGLLVAGLASEAIGGALRAVEREGKNAYRLSLPGA